MKLDPILELFGHFSANQPPTRLYTSPPAQEQLGSCVSVRTSLMTHRRPFSFVLVGAARVDRAIAPASGAGSLFSYQS
jgi:hypothetical protein